MTVFGVVILRFKYPDLPRPYKMWGYPITPLIFVAISLWFVVNILIARPGASLMGTLIIASGILIFFIRRRKLGGRQIKG
jgi:APA family basic amino acid/polyamine antiporter